jgi:hypothetical protein
MSKLFFDVAMSLDGRQPWPRSGGAQTITYRIAR